jgi:hypothetical protein
VVLFTTVVLRWKAAGFLVLLEMTRSGGVACISSLGGWMGAARYSYSPSFCARLGATSSQAAATIARLLTLDG